MEWVFDQNLVNWDEVANLYRVAPLGEKNPHDLEVVFSNSMFKCFVLENGMLVGVGRVLADGADCAYICDVAVHPAVQRLGIGAAIIAKLKELSARHKKIILYARPGTEGFYRRLGFRSMRTAMAIFEDEDRAVKTGLLG